MVMTHKKVKEQKKMKIFVKEDNPRRKFMPKAEAVKDNERIREDRLKVERYAEDLKAERLREAGEGTGTQDQKSDDIERDREHEEEKKAEKTIEEKVSELKKKLESEKGPGSAARKKKIQAEIDKLLNTYE